MSQENLAEQCLQAEGLHTSSRRMTDSFNSQYYSCGDELDNVPVSINEFSRKGPKLRPEHFDGSEDFETYFEQFECIADLGGWSPKERALTLAACLKGQARRFYASLGPSEKSCYQPLAFQLRQRFGTGSRPGLYWTAKFENRFRLPGETIATFSDELLILARKAYPYLDCNTQHHLALQQWLKSMSPEIKWRCMEKNCQSIREAEEVAEMYELIMKPHDKKRGVYTVTQEKSTDLKQEENSTTSYYNHQPVKNKRLCFCCQDPSHRLATCPIYKRCKQQEEQMKKAAAQENFARPPQPQRPYYQQQGNKMHDHQQENGRHQTWRAARW